MQDPCKAVKCLLKLRQKSTKTCKTNDNYFKPKKKSITKAITKSCRTRELPCNIWKRQPTNNNEYKQKC